MRSAERAIGVRAARAGRGEGEAGADPGLASGRSPQPLRRGHRAPRRRRSSSGATPSSRCSARRSRARCASRRRSSSRSSAEPGVGKSRLVWEFREEIDRRPDLVRWRQGRCLPYGEGITFWALGEIVKAEAGVLETDSPPRGSREARRDVADLFADEADRAWIVDRLAPLVGAQDEVSGVGREEAFSAWQRYLEALAAHRPTVLVIEDLHWADACACSTSSSTCSTGPRTCRSWSSPPLAPSSTTLVRAGAAAGATRRRSASRRCRTRTPRDSSRLSSSGRSCPPRRRRLCSSARAEIRSTPSSSSACSARLARRDRHGTSGDRAGAHRRAARHTLARAQEPVAGRIRAREGLLDGSARCDG